MANLVFFDADHRYELDGEALPSVSEVIRFASREIYGSVYQYTLDNAAERGTKVHKLLEALDKYGSAEVPEDLAGYINAYLTFRHEHKAAWKYIERSFPHREKLYAGTIDRYGTVDGTPAIVDFKTSYQVQKVLADAQLNLYRELLPGDPVEKLYILHLGKDGNYKLIDIPISDAVSGACLTLHNALRKTKRRKKTE